MLNYKLLMQANIWQDENFSNLQSSNLSILSNIWRKSKTVEIVRFLFQFKNLPRRKIDISNMNY